MSPEHQNKKAEATEDTILEWVAPDRLKHEKGWQWFVAAGTLLILLLGYAFATNSWTMAVAFIVLAGVYMISHHTDPKAMQVRITTLGIYAGKRKFPFNQVKAFWLIYEPPHVKVLKLMTTDKIMGEVTIQLDGQNPGEVRNVLLKQIPEYEGRGESLVDVIIRMAKL